MNISAGQIKARVWDVYVAGSCIDNRGGYGVYATCRGEERELSGGEPNTTHNCMELLAAITAIEHFPIGSPLRIHSDATYLAQNVTQHMPRWKQRDWKRADGEPVANQELWQRLDEAIQRRSVKFHWRPKGLKRSDRYGEPGHDRALDLARAGAEMQAECAGPVGHSG